MTVLKNVAHPIGRRRGWGFTDLRQRPLRAAEQFYNDPQWASITDWKAELAPYYDQAKRMLGVATNPKLTPADEIFKSVADDLGVGDTFHPTQVGVFFGEPGKTVPDPYFGGVGPDRAGCIFCARCMTGCPHNAKNTTERNYLYLAEKAGAQIHPLTTVVDVRESPGGGYEVETVHSWTVGSQATPDMAGRSDRVFRRRDRHAKPAAPPAGQRIAYRGYRHGWVNWREPTRRLPCLPSPAREPTWPKASPGRHRSTRMRTPTSRPSAAARAATGDALLNTTLVDGDKHRLAKWALINLRHPAAFARTFNVRNAPSGG